MYCKTIYVYDVKVGHSRTNIAFLKMKQRGKRFQDRIANILKGYLLKEFIFLIAKFCCLAPLEAKILPRSEPCFLVTPASDKNSNRLMRKERGRSKNCKSNKDFFPSFFQVCTSASPRPTCPTRCPRPSWPASRRSSWPRSPTSLWP